MRSIRGFGPDLVIRGVSRWCKWTLEDLLGDTLECSPKLALLCSSCCRWRVISQASLMLYSIPVYRECVLRLQSWAFQKCLRHLCNLHSGSFVLYATEQSLIRRQPPSACNSCPPSMGQRRQMILTFFAIWDIFWHWEVRTVLEGATGPAGDTCPSGAGAGDKAGCLRHPKQCYVSVFRKLNRAPLAAVTRFPVIKIGFWTLSSRQMPA